MITIGNDNACSLSFLAKKWNNMDFIEKEIISLELDNCLSINDFNFYHNNKIIFYYDFDNDSFSVKFKEKMYIYNEIIIISFINESKTVQQLDRLFENFISNFYKELFEYKDNKLEILFNNCYPIEIAFHSKISNDEISKIIEEKINNLFVRNTQTLVVFYLGYTRNEFNLSFIEKQFEYLDEVLSLYPSITISDERRAIVRIFNHFLHQNQLEKYFTSDFNVEFEWLKRTIFFDSINKDNIKLLNILIKYKCVYNVPFKYKLIYLKKKIEKGMTLK